MRKLMGIFEQISYEQTSWIFNKTFWKKLFLQTDTICDSHIMNCLSFLDI